jgi:hypothetical protein
MTNTQFNDIVNAEIKRLIAEAVKDYMKEPEEKRPTCPVCLDYHTCPSCNPDTIQIDRKVAEEWMDWIGRYGTLTPPNEKMWDSVRKALGR